MGLTLLEAAKSEQNVLRRGLYNELSAGELSAIIPFVNTPGAGVFYNKVQELPGVGFRGVNEVAEATYGIINPQAEQYKIMASDIDVDTFELDTEGEEVRTNQVQMKIDSMRLTLEDNFINGDETANPRAFDGLRRRINVGSSQAINANGALSLAALDELIDATDANGGRKVLIMNQRMNRLLSQASRNTAIGGFINYEQDEFGRRVRFYNEVEIVTTKVNAQNNQIQPFTEGTTGAPAGGAATSIYCVSFGDNLCTMHQGLVRGEFGPSIRPLGEVDDAPVDRTRFEWYVLMSIKHGRAASRLYGVTNAAVVA
jgi:hypothetical protein